MLKCYLTRNFRVVPTTNDLFNYCSCKVGIIGVNMNDLGNTCYRVLLNIIMIID